MKLDLSKNGALLGVYNILVALFPEKNYWNLGGLVKLSTPHPALFLGIAYKY